MLSNYVSVERDTPAFSVPLLEWGTQLLTWHLQVNTHEALQPFCLKKLGRRRDFPEEETPLRPGKGRNWSCILGRGLCPCTLVQEDWVPVQGIRPMMRTECVSILAKKNQWQQPIEWTFKSPSGQARVYSMFFLEFICLCLIYKFDTLRD